MKTNLYLADGTEVDKDTIRQAVAQGRAVLRWSHRDGYNAASLLILDTVEDANLEASRDTRGQCYSMWDEQWSGYPSSVGVAVRAAAGLVKVS